MPAGKSSPLRPITDDEIRAYEDDGVVLLKGILDPAWVSLVAEAIEEDIRQPGPYYHGYKTNEGEGYFHGNMRIWESNDRFRDYVLHSPLPEIAAAFLKSDKINLLYDQLFVKEPGTNLPTPWHNDQPYWPVSGLGVMSFWLAVDPVTKENGAMEFVRGSHKWDRWFQPRTFAPGATHDYDQNPDYEPIPDIDAARDDYDIVTWDMDPGDLLAFHAMALHTAGGNQRKDIRRRGYTVRYIDRDARYDPRAGTAKGLWNETLAPGAVMDSDQYPVVWPR